MRKTARLSLVALLMSMVLIAGSLPLTFAGPAERLLVEYGAGQKEAARNAILESGGMVHYEFDSIHALAVTIEPGARARLGVRQGILGTEPDGKRYPAGDTGEVMPFGIERVQAPLVWAEGYDGEGVTVCIIDSGLGVHHEDFRDEDGLAVDVIGGEPAGWDVDWCGHGTHVAGTITAIGDNDRGVVGVSPGDVSLYIVKVFGDDCLWAYSSDLIDAAYKCADAGANIISMSLSGSGRYRVEQMAFDDLYSQGILSVAAASNDGNHTMASPASYDSVISVGATDIDNQIAEFSNQNPQVELVAPGVGVLSTVPYIPNSKLIVDEEEYIGQPFEFSPYGEIGGQLVDGGLCLSTGDWAEQVVLCERGDATFYDKVMNVQNSGGVAAIIYNNATGLFSGTLGEEGDYILALSLSQEDGQYLVANKLGQTGTVQSAPPLEGSSYEAWNGTSMATPHVSGVAALLWSSNRKLTNAQIREAMAMTALDLGEPGRDFAYGYGLVQAYDALQYLEAMKPGKGPNK